jgi:hypothetical protein
MEVLVVCPQPRDFQSVRDAGLEHRYRVRYAGPDLDGVDAFDANAFVASCSRLPIDGVVATKDRSALLAAALAERLGLPGPTPQQLAACQHKPTSRARQRQVVPDATPDFALLEGHRLPFHPPFFVKPVVGRLSQNAQRIDELAQLLLLVEDDYGELWGEIARVAGLAPAVAHGFLAEELLEGEEVTLEGYVFEGRVTVIGITDSVKYSGTNSFERFEYPTRLPEERQVELAELAERLVHGLGFDGGFFNVEYFVPEAGPAKIIEINGRLASQFAPLVHALHGRSTYDALFALACGCDPHWHAARPDGVAVSYCLRTFRDAFVAAVPEPEESLELLVSPGLRLSEQGGTNDTESYRLAIFYEVGETREEALARCRARARRVRFELLERTPAAAEA